MIQFPLKYKPYGERSILIEWPSIIVEDILINMLAFKRQILQNYYKQNIIVNHAYNSLLISYNIEEFSFDTETFNLKIIYDSIKIYQQSSCNLWKLPVCYDTSFGIDIEWMSSEKGLSKSEIIELHSQSIYTVYFIGFLPGFLYLGGLNDILHTPRKSTPRLKIEKGSVAIGGNQTGIYPNQSPGGWNVIGNCPINFFNVRSDAPCFANSGDKIKFIPVSLDEYQDIKASINLGTFDLESEVLSG